MTFPAFAENWVSNPEPASFQMVRFRSDVHPIKVIDDFLQQHAEGGLHRSTGTTTWTGCRGTSGST
jgi:hypothetical protein